MQMAGIDFEEEHVSTEDPSTRAELLLLWPSFLVPCLLHDGLKVWDTLAIAQYLHELYPEAGLLPTERAQRAHCRSICGEMHSGFSNLRSALPMNIKVYFPGFKAWAGARGDILLHHNDMATNALRNITGPIRSEQSPAPPTLCIRRSAPASSPTTLRSIRCRPNTAAPSWRLPHMHKWRAAAKVEPDDLEELDVEF